MADLPKLIDGDLVPSWHGFPQVTQALVNTVETRQIDDDTISPDLAIDFYGQGRHALLVWDVHAWRCDLPNPDNLAGASATTATGIVADNNATATAPTSINVQLETTVQRWGRAIDNTQSAAGETVVVTKNLTNEIINVPQVMIPMESIDGVKMANIGQLLTSSHYWMLLSTSGNSSIVKSSQFAMYARRIAIPLDEALIENLDLASAILTTTLIGSGR